MKEQVLKLISSKVFVIIIYVLFALAASVQSLSIGTRVYVEGGPEYNTYNNYTIFEKSFQHLKNHQDLYVLYPEEHWDLYKYTPSFSVFFGIFSSLPDWLGLNLWNLLNALVLLFSVYYLPRFDNRQKGFILLIALIELMTSMQNAQSNALIAGLLIFAFGFLERNKPLFATLCIILSAFIKLFGIVGFAIFLFYPGKWKSALYSIVWFILIAALPLMFVDMQQYLKLLSSYQHLLQEDHVASYGFSVMGWLHAWLHIEFNKNAVVLLGAALFLLPFYQTGLYKEFMFKLLVLSSVLIWIVIFNHKAESPTFIIAMAGVALWFVGSKKNMLHILLFAGAFLLTSLSPTDLFPKYVRNTFVTPYMLKVFPCILIWLNIIYDLMTLRKHDKAHAGLQ